MKGKEAARGKMSGWAKRILRVRKEEKTATVDPQEGSYDDVTKLQGQLKQPDPASLKKGQKIRFYYIADGSYEGYWPKLLMLRILILAQISLISINFALSSCLELDPGHTLTKLA